MIILEIFYLVCAALLAIYGLNSLLLTWLYRRQMSGAPVSQEGAAGTEALSGEPYPSVTVQLPIYNERHVVERLIDSVVRLDWPAERLQIQILDDSTDDTRQRIAAVVARHRAGNCPVRLEVVHRPDRRNFKAGALQHGLASASGEFIAIFDADFMPPPDFLQKTIPAFADARIGCIQTRWGHVNPESSRLTQAEALGIDGHFMVEQAARSGLKAFLNFNGTAGVWRRTCMHEAGGWQGDTLTEDLDLSYRAQLGGWRIVYQPEMIVPAELPVQIDAFKRQQFRWAKGSIQTALKLLGRLWRARQPVWLKLLGTLHLTNYSVHPLMLLNLLLTLPMMVSHSPFLNLAPVFTLSAIGPPLLYWTTLRRSSLPIQSRLGRLALLIALGAGLSVSNSRAVLEALFNVKSEFKRTPKFAVTDASRTWQASTYALPRDPVAWVELSLALYACGLLVRVTLLGIWWLIPWMLLYAGGYTYVSGLAFVQAWEARSVRAEAMV
ncbi:MAG TPA: glycosyltransferase [Anaerolineae bacterium]